LAGAQVSSENGYVGCNAGSAGTVTVSGANSKWTNTGPLAIGSGSLTVDDGAQVTAQTFYALLSSLHGNGRITATAGAILDADLVFNASGGTQCTVPFGSGGTLVVNAAGGDLGVRTGSLTVADGVTIEAANGYLGYQPGSIAIATVTGPGSTWTNSGVLFVGNSGTGTLAVNAGAQVSNSSGYLGYNAGSSGAATVTGSTWTNSSDLFVGNSGVGTLTIAAGGQVSNANGYVGYNAGSSGAVTVSGANSKWMNTGTLYVGYKGSGSLTLADGAEVTTKTLFASLSSLHGNGTITATTGAVLDADLVFNASYGMQSTLPFGSGGTLTVNFAGGDLGVGTGSLTVADGIAINSANGYLGYWSVSVATATLTGLGSTWTNSGSLNVGFSGSGSLAVEAGACVTGVSGTLGCNSGSVGVAVVTGLGSKWTSSDYLTVGKFGAGTLTVKAGGYISSSGGMLGFSAGVTGTATVVGAGSAWTSNRTIYIGASGSGRLAIREGGTVTASAVSVNSQSLLTLDVGHGSSLGVGAGTGTITNAGKIRFLTGLQPTAGGQFSPIAAATWSGTGIYQAVGGTWNTTTHVFTVSDTLPGVSGTPIAVDLSQQQRVLVQENAINRAIGASFLSKTGTGSTLNFTAATLTDADLPSLQALLQPGESVLNAWNLSADGTGYVATDPIYLSLSVPSDLSRHDVEIWKLTGTTWSPFTADDLTTADGYASFTITGLSGYAVTVVPEPSTILLLLLAAAPLIARRLLRSKRA
jgi:T5SS/PEP-CTERM-associated repeat protein